MGSGGSGGERGKGTEKRERGGEGGHEGKGLQASTLETTLGRKCKHKRSSITIKYASSSSLSTSSTPFCFSLSLHLSSPPLISLCVYLALHLNNRPEKAKRNNQATESLACVRACGSTIPTFPPENFSHYITIETTTGECSRSFAGANSDLARLTFQKPGRVNKSGEGHTFRGNGR